MGNSSGKERIPEACTDEPEPGVTNAFLHDELFPLKAYEGNQLRINEVFQKAAEALEEFEARNGRRLPFLLSSNFRFVVKATADESVSKGRYTGFAMKAVLVENEVTVKQAKKCEKTRHLLAPEILKGNSAKATSASYSLYMMYFDALKKKMKLVKTKDKKYHFVEEATLHKGPLTETGWWKLNPQIMSALQGGLDKNPKHRLGIEAFTRLFKRTSDGRYVDSGMCLDAFDPLDYEASDEVNFFGE